MLTASGRRAEPQPPRVLLVDDNADAAELLRILLSRRGFEVRTACSVATAVAAVEAAPVDVLVSDINLPDGTGCDLLRRLRADTPVPAIALSGHDRPADRLRGREAGFDDYLAKPVGIDHLVEALRRVTAATAANRS